MLEELHWNENLWEAEMLKKMFKILLMFFCCELISEMVSKKGGKCCIITKKMSFAPPTLR